MEKDNNIWEQQGIESASQVMDDVDLQKKYVVSWENVFQHLGRTKFPNKIFDILEDENYHLLNELLTRLGLFKEMSELESYRTSLKDSGTLQFYFDTHRPDWYNLYISAPISATIKAVKQSVEFGRVLDIIEATNDYSELYMLQDSIRKRWADGVITRRAMEMALDTVAEKMRMPAWWEWWLKSSLDDRLKKLEELAPVQSKATEKTFAESSPERLPEYVKYVLREHFGERKRNNPNDGINNLFGLPPTITVSKYRGAVYNVLMPAEDMLGATNIYNGYTLVRGPRGGLRWQNPTDPKRYISVAQANYENFVDWTQQLPHIKDKVDSVMEDYKNRLPNLYHYIMTGESGKELSRESSPPPTEEKKTSEPESTDAILVSIAEGKFSTGNYPTIFDALYEVSATDEKLFSKLIDTYALRKHNTTPTESHWFWEEFNKWLKHSQET